MSMTESNDKVNNHVGNQIFALFLYVFIAQEEPKARR